MAAKERSHDRAKASIAIAEGAMLQSKNDEAEMTTIQKIAIMLNSPCDWEVWVDMIQNRAKIAKIWKYIDPLIDKTIYLRCRDLPYLFLKTSILRKPLSANLPLKRSKN